MDRSSVLTRYRVMGPLCIPFIPVTLKFAISMLFPYSALNIFSFGAVLLASSNNEGSTITCGDAFSKIFLRVEVS